MIESKTIYTFIPKRHDDTLLLMSQSWPWSVLQVVPTTPETFDEIVEKCLKRGMVGRHDTDRTFCIIRTAGGNLDGTRPECTVVVNTQQEAREYLDAIRDEMAQAAVWYHANKLSL